MRQRLRAVQMEAGRVWTHCRDLHAEARRNHETWPTRDDLQKATKGLYALHSQTVQMICHKFLTVVENTKSARRQNKKLRYPYREKRYHMLYWPAQAVSVERGRVVLPMGRGRRSLVFKVDLPDAAGAASIRRRQRRRPDRGARLWTSVRFIRRPSRPRRATPSSYRVEQSAR
jgi:putative transposase